MNRRTPHSPPQQGGRAYRTHSSSDHPASRRPQPRRTLSNPASASYLHPPHSAYHPSYAALPTATTSHSYPYHNPYQNSYFSQPWQPHPAPSSSVHRTHVSYATHNAHHTARYTSHSYPAQTQRHTQTQRPGRDISIKAQDASPRPTHGCSKVAPHAAHHSSQPPTRTVVLIGNPGVGKSTLLNALAGHHFRSGTSLGTGLTRKAVSVSQETVRYFDTPGLDDALFRMEAAAEVSRALSGAGEVCMVFVVTLEAGRARRTDVEVLRAVVSALQLAGVSIERRWSLVINKCSKGVVETLREPGVEEALLEPFWEVCEVTHVTFLRLEARAHGMDDAALEARDRVREFVSLAPTFVVPGSSRVAIDALVYATDRDEVGRLLAAERGKYQEVSQEGRRGSKQPTKKVGPAGDSKRRGEHQTGWKGRTKGRGREKHRNPADSPPFLLQ